MRKKKAFYVSFQGRCAATTCRRGRGGPLGTDCAVSRSALRGLCPAFHSLTRFLYKLQERARAEAGGYVTYGYLCRRLASPAPLSSVKPRLEKKV